MAEIENLKIGNGTIHIVGNQDIVADSWEAGKTYVADRSYVIREHILYVCNTTHTSVEPFDPTKWTATTIGEALGMAGSANVIECTLAEYTAWKAGGLLINETTYILTDAPNLNATSEDLSYDGGATSTHDVIEGNKTKLDGQTDTTDPLFKVVYFGNSESISFTADGVVSLTANQLNISTPTGYTPISVVSIFANNNDVFYRSWNASATGTQSFCVAHKIGAAASIIFNCAILYAKTSYVKVIT